MFYPLAGERLQRLEQDYAALFAVNKIKRDTRGQDSQLDATTRASNRLSKRLSRSIQEHQEEKARISVRQSRPSMGAGAIEAVRRLSRVSHRAEDQEGQTK